jgi:hypothetical protein
VTTDDPYPPGWSSPDETAVRRYPLADPDPGIDGPTQRLSRPDGGPGARAYAGDLPAPHLSRERWARIVIDRAVPEIEPRPTATASYRPDTIFDGWSTDDFTLRLASVRGRRHRGEGTPRQDDVVAAVHAPTGSIVFAVADGVSGAPHSHVGAALAGRSAVAGAVAELERRAVIDWTGVFQRTVANLVGRAARLLGADGVDTARAAAVLGTSLLAGVLTPTAGVPMLSLASTGDPAAWLLRRQRYERLTVRPAGTAPPLPHLPDRLTRVDRTIPTDAVLLVGTAGFADPLGDGRGHVGELFSWLFGMSPTALALAHVLDFAQEAFDDDRTLLAVSPNRARTRRLDQHRRGSEWSAWHRG